MPTGTHSHHEGAMTLFDCAPEHAWALVVLSAITVVLYLILAFARFIPAAVSSRTLKEKIIWFSIATIFPFCGMNAYATTIMSGWMPESSYDLRVIFGIVNIFACIAFFVYTRGTSLSAKPAEEKLDEVRQVIVSSDEQHLDPAQAMSLLRKSLEEDGS